MSSTSECDHLFEYMSTTKKYEHSGYNTHYIRVDYFFCARCLEQREKKRDEYCRDEPDWFKAKRDHSNGK